jgi:hypothetical protein
LGSGGGARCLAAALGAGGSSAWGEGLGAAALGARGWGQAASLGARGWLAAALGLGVRAGIGSWRLKKRKENKKR